MSNATNPSKDSPTTRSDTVELEQAEKRPADREGTRSSRVFEPDVDIVENTEAYLVVAELPGVDREHVHVSLEDQILTIDADLATEPDSAWRAVYSEFRQGAYHRQFRISDRIDADAIRATMRDGVLQLELPKVAQARPRTIAIES